MDGYLACAVRWPAGVTKLFITLPLSLHPCKLRHERYDSQLTAEVAPDQARLACQARQFCIIAKVWRILLSFVHIDMKDENYKLLKYIQAKRCSVKVIVCSMSDASSGQRTWE